MAVTIKYLNGKLFKKSSHNHCVHMQIAPVNFPVYYCHMVVSDPGMLKTPFFHFHDKN